MTVIRDMLYVNTLEKELQRRLTEDELSGDEEFQVTLPNGRTRWEKIPLLAFPDDLLSAPECFISEADPDEIQENI